MPTRSRSLIYAFSHLHVAKLFFAETNIRVLAMEARNCDARSRRQRIQRGLTDLICETLLPLEFTSTAVRAPLTLPFSSPSSSFESRQQNFNTSLHSSREKLWFLNCNFQLLNFINKLKPCKNLYYKIQLEAETQDSSIFLVFFLVASTSTGFCAVTRFSCRFHSPPSAVI